MSPEAPLGMTSAYRQLEEARAPLYPIFQSKDNLLIVRRIRDWSAGEIEANQRAAFAEADIAIPLEVLANYLARAQLALLQ